MERLFESEAEPVVRQVLGFPSDISFEEGRPGGPDLIARSGGHSYFIELKRNARTASVAQAIQQLLRYISKASGRERPVPVLVVDRMGAAGARLCSERGVSWIDLDGNADISDTGLRVLIRGQKRVRRRSREHGFNPFSRRASRVVHALLLSRNRHLTRAEIQNKTRLDKGYISKSVDALKEQGYIEIIGARRGQKISLINWEVLFSAWEERYQPPPVVTYGLVSSKDGFETVTKVSEILHKAKNEGVFSGLAAAAVYARFGNFRRARAYITDALPESISERLNVSPDPRGKNVVFFLNDGNASIGATKSGSAFYVSPYLAYLDLADEPERAEEAREELRRVITDLSK